MNAAWKNKPFYTFNKFICSYLRLLHPASFNVIQFFDKGRSRIHVDLTTCLGKGIYRYGYHTAECEFIGITLSQGDIFIDAGANVGFFTLVAAARVGTTGKVIAFEPARATRLQLVENLGLNSFYWVDVREEALGAEPGECQFVSFQGDASGVSSFKPPHPGKGKVEVVRVTSLDELLKTEDCNRIKIIKLDIEGGEFAALKGAKNLLSRCNPNFLVEFARENLKRQGHSVEELFNEFLRLDFRAFKIAFSDNHHPVLIEQNEPPQEECDLWMTRE